MIELQNISKSYGERSLFNEVTINIFPGEKVGLIGRNGHGKSTLLRILVGEENPDEGRVIIPNKYTIGYLKQTVKFTEDIVLKEVCKGLPEEHKLDHWKAEKILTGLGFTDEYMQGSPSVLSGGFQMRMELAKVLVSDPDLLLLDEPTNFLDIVSIRWLENFLKRWRSELIIVSHDRNFVDNVTTHILGIHRCSVRKIKGNTKQYYSQILKEEEVYEKKRLNEGKKTKQMEEYINTFRAKARRAKSVQSSVKRLAKMDKSEKLSGIGTVSFSFNSTSFRPPVVMDVKNIKFSYTGEEPMLIDDLSFMVERGEKICIAGANGKGKTTLAKLLAGRLDISGGEITMNPQAVTSFYEQGNTARLHESNTVEDEVMHSSPEKNRGKVRDVCGSMMFSGDDALKKIAVLSGGEKSRVLLAKTLLSPSNLLILDEPTHHLDMDTCNALFDSVEKFEGAAIVVTHDEYFLHKVATKLIVFLEDKVIVYPGNYSEFLDQVGWDKGVTDGVLTKTTEKKTENVTSNRKETRKARAEFLARKNKILKPLETKMADLEKKIETEEEKKQRMEQDILEAVNNGESNKIQELSKSIHDGGARITRLYDELESIVDEYDNEKQNFEGETDGK